MSAVMLKLTCARIAVLLLCCVHQLVPMVRSNPNEARLLDDLFESYNIYVRPVCVVETPTEVKVGMAIRQILDMNEAEQTISASVWLRLQWSDCQLQWDPIDYGTIDTLIVPYRRIWTPDITLYDNAGNGLSGIEDYRPSIQFNGSVSYNFPTILKSTCQIDVTSFPFDTQMCPLSFGTWSFNELQINITNSSSEADVTSFISSGEWNLVGAPVERSVVYYGCCSEPFSDVTFYVKLNRRPLYFVCNIIFPCVLISAISLLGFLLPTDSREKVSLEITMFLCLSIFMVVVSQALPPTSQKFPIIGVYFCILMMLSALSTVLNIIIINVHFRGHLNHRIPQWMRDVFLGNMAGFLGIFQENSRHAIMDKQQCGTSLPLEKRKTLAHPETFQEIPVEGLDPKNDERKEAGFLDEWKAVASVMDRLFFFIVLFLLVLCTVLLFFVMLFG